MKSNKVIQIIYTLITIIIFIHEKQFIKKISNKHVKNNKKIRNLQEQQIENIYYLNITDFYVNDNKLYFNILSDPKIAKNVSISLNLLISIYYKEDGSWDSEYYEYDVVISNKSGIYNTILDFNITSVTEIFIYEIETYDYDEHITYNITYPKTFYVIDPSNKGYSTNTSIVGKYDYTIDITEFSLTNNTLNLNIDLRPETLEIFNLSLILSKHTYNDTLGYWEGGNIHIQIKVNSTSKEYTTVLDNFEISGYTEISIIDAWVENVNDLFLIVYFPQTFLIFNKTEESKIIYSSEISQSIYYINISDFSLNNNEIEFFLTFEPQKSENIFLVITLDISFYNDSLLYYADKFINLTIFVNYNSDKYTAILENFYSIDPKEISIKNVYINQSEENDIYNVYYTNKKLSIESSFETTSESTIISTSESTKVTTSEISSELKIEPTIDLTENGNNGSSEEKEEESDGENLIGNYSKNTSGKSNTGIIIGVAAGILVLIGIIIGIIFFCIKKRNNKNKETGTHNSIISNSSLTMNKDYEDINLKDPKQNIRAFIFETQTQDKIEIKIESDKNLKELRKLYFEKISRIDLINDKSIYFLYGGKHHYFFSQDLVKKNFKDYLIWNRIIVIDGEDKIYNNNNIN